MSIFSMSHDQTASIPCLVKNMNNYKALSQELTGIMVCSNADTGLNKKEWILVELKITQTKHPLWISNGKMSKFNSCQE